MPRIAIYDPPGCCSTGVCDPGLSESMAQFAAAIERLIKQGIDVERYNLGAQPGAFADNPLIKGTLDSDGMDCLPLVVVDDRIVSKGAYLDWAELTGKVGIDGADGADDTDDAGTDDAAAAKASACCG